MNKNQVKGRVDSAKGTVKEAVGKALGNKQMQYRGAVEKTGGKVEKAYGDLKSDMRKNSK